MASLTIKQTDNRWWEHPDIPCRNRPEFADTALVRGNGRREKLLDMARMCEFCPVIRECTVDMLGGETPIGQVRAGRIFR